MKLGVRKPNLKSSIKARTTGRAKRTIKRAFNPLYGKKGMGWINNPKKALYNKIYHKTTVPALSVVGFSLLLLSILWYFTLWIFELLFKLTGFMLKITIGALLTLFYLAIAIIEQITGKEILPAPTEE